MKKTKNRPLRCDVTKGTIPKKSIDKGCLLVRGAKKNHSSIFNDRKENPFTIHTNRRVNSTYMIASSLYIVPMSTLIDITPRCTFLFYAISN